jgi:ubiquinone/menaquinone biosynthesis C-methylase UbiE
MTELTRLKTDKIEILGLDLFSSHREEMQFIESLQKDLRQGIGWHYYLDLAWMVRQISQLKKGSLVLDAGAGTGLAQFVLAELGYDVLSVDFANRNFSGRALQRYSNRIHHINDQTEEVFDNRYTRHLATNYQVSLVRSSLIPGWLLPKLRSLRRLGKPLNGPKNISSLTERHEKRVADSGLGRIFLYKGDLKNLSDLADSAVDGIISISALEHNEHKDFKRCVAELSRVLRPGGKMCITISASTADDWLHEPSLGWCYSEATLKDLFDLPKDTPSNYEQKHELFERLRGENNELSKRLAPFYFKSGNNGMPWGIWDPQYQPVGVVKIKSESGVTGGVN